MDNCDDFIYFALEASPDDIAAAAVDNGTKKP